MATLTIEKLPDALYWRLEERAARNRRSINAEAIACLERSLGVISVEPEVLLARLAAVRDRARDLYLTDADLKEARGRGRP